MTNIEVTFEWNTTMKIYIAAFLTSLVVALGATFIISGTVGPELDALANAFSGSQTGVDPNQPVLRPALLLTFSDGQVLEDEIVQAAFAIGLKPAALNSIQRMIHRISRSLDLDKPIAVAICFRKGTTKPTLLFCLPVSQQDAFENALNEFGAVYQERREKWVAVDELGNLRIKQQGEYTFISTNNSVFDRIPESDTWFSEFASQNDIGLQIDPAQIPDEFLRSFLADLNRRSYRLGTSESERMFAQLAIARIENLIYDASQIVLGMDFDLKNQQISLDAKIIADKGSRVAEGANRNRESAASKFGGFQRGDAGFNLNCCSMVVDGNWELQRLVATQLNSLKFNLFGQQPRWDETSVWLESLVTACCETNEIDKIDFGMFSTVVEGHVNTAMGIHTTDPGQVKSLMKRIFEASQQPDATSICRLDFATHHDVVFHQIERRISDSDVRDSVYGQSLLINVGIGERAVYVGLGEHSLELLKASIDDSMRNDSTSHSAHPHSVMTGSFEFLPWLSILANDTTDLRYFRSLIRNSAKNDRLSFQTTAIENGYETHIAVEMGFARIIWKSVRRLIDRRDYNAGAGSPVRVMTGQSGQIPFSSMFRAYGESR